MQIRVKTLDVFLEKVEKIDYVFKKLFTKFCTRRGFKPTGF
jgi:hypothetical protein